MVRAVLFTNVQNVGQHPASTWPKRWNLTVEQQAMLNQRGYNAATCRAGIIVNGAIWLIFNDAVSPANAYAHIVPYKICTEHGEGRILLLAPVLRVVEGSAFFVVLDRSVAGTVEELAIVAFHASDGVKTEIKRTVDLDVIDTCTSPHEFVRVQESDYVPWVAQMCRETIAGFVRVAAHLTCFSTNI